MSFWLGIFPKKKFNLRLSFTKNNLTRLFLEGWNVICFLKLIAKDLTITHHMKEPGFFNSTSKFLCLVTMTCVKAFSGEENSSLKIYLRPIQCYFVILTVRVYFPLSLNYLKTSYKLRDDLVTQNTLCAISAFFRFLKVKVFVQ